MRGRGHKSATAGRQGFTLLELMLTLSILVIIVSLTFPLMEQPLANQRLRKAADLVRAKWIAARVEALDSGEICLFRYVADENRFSIECRHDPDTWTDSTWGDAAAAPTTSQPAAELQARQQTLPEGVTFMGSETAADTRASTIVSTPTDASQPILFYPDGTTSTARLILRNEYGRTIELSLRGSTGVVTVGGTTAAEEGL